MKSFILFLFISITLWSADIDIKLYEGNNTISYHEEVSKLIDQEKPQDQPDIERISTERMIMSKLKNMLSFSAEIGPLPDSLLSDDQNISTENYLSYLNALTDTYLTIDKLKEEQSKIQTKLQYLNKSIQNITAEEKQNLRLYQLQYAFYKLQSKNNVLSINRYETLVKEGEKKLTKALNKVTFDVPSLKKELIDINTKLPNIEQKAIALNLAKERELMHKETLSKTLNEKLIANSIEMMNTLSSKIDHTLLLSLASLHLKENTKMLDLFNKTTSDLAALTPELKKYFTLKRTIIKKLLTKEAGNVSVALSDVEQSAESLYDYTYNKLNEALFVFNEHPISIMDILKVILILVLGFIFAAFYKRKIMNLATVGEKLSYSSAKMISNFGYYILVLITLLIALNSIGLDLKNLGLIVGALSIGIGFGLQTIISNLAAGIILMFERTIRLGDYIEVSDTIRGTVNDMKMRSTTVTTNDNIDVIIPNSSFIQNNVINWTLENDIRRIHIPFSVAYGTSNQKVEEVIMEELKNTSINYVKNSVKYTTVIWMTAMGSSSVDYELVIWVRGQSTLKPAGTKSDFLKFIYHTLNKHHIEIPFPQLDLHVKQTGPIKEGNDPQIT